MGVAVLSRKTGGRETSLYLFLFHVVYANNVILLGVFKGVPKFKELLQLFEAIVVSQSELDRTSILMVEVFKQSTKNLHHLPEVQSPYFLEILPHLEIYPLHTSLILKLTLKFTRKVRVVKIRTNKLMRSLMLNMKNAKRIDLPS